MHLRSNAAEMGPSARTHKSGGTTRTLAGSVRMYVSLYTIATGGRVSGVAV